jgi:hypothetical protein
MKLPVRFSDPAQSLAEQLGNNRKPLLCGRRWGRRFRLPRPLAGDDFTASAARGSDRRRDNRSRDRKGAISIKSAILLTLALLAQAFPPAKPYSTWTDYGGAPDSSQYSALKQIDKTNVSRLEQAWFYPVAEPQDELRIQSAHR